MKVSVCICTCNRPELLNRLLGSLQTMRRDDFDAGDLHIIVVDNNPNDQVRRVCEHAADTLPVALHYVAEPERGISSARNRAINEALDRDADFVAFIDDDDLPEADWLLQLMAKQKASGAGLVFGSWRPMINAEAPAWYQDLRYFKTRKNRVKRKYGVEIPDRIATCNVLIARSVLEQQATKGPVFSPEFSFTGGEDKEFFIRALKAGASFETADKSLVNKNYTGERATVPGVLKLAFRQGSVLMHVTQRHATIAEVKRRRRKAYSKILVDLLHLPATLFSKGRLMSHLFNISKNLGAIYGYSGHKYDYYR